MATQESLKQAVAHEVLQYIEDDTIVGVGTGSTVRFFIDALRDIKGRIQGAVSSSNASEAQLKALGIPVFNLNEVDTLPVYIDSADEINHQLQMIKGGGGALTREKIVAAVAKQFICIADESKYVDLLGTFPLPIEVIPMARSYVARQLLKLGGQVRYREGMVTDNGNIILDVHYLSIAQPDRLESEINQIVGVVSNGLFSHRPADRLLLGKQQGGNIIVETKQRS